MSKRPEEKEKKDSVNEPTKYRGKIVLITIIFILGLVTFTALYLNFNKTYQLNKPQNEVRSGSIGNIVSNTPNLKTIASNISNINIPEPENKEPTEQVNNDCLKQITCSDLLNFTQEYFLLKNNIIQNQEFSNQIEIISQYQIKSDLLEKSLKNLTIAATNNYSYEYFQKEFNSLIKILYKNTRNYFAFDPRNYILIRKIDEEAMKHEDLDKFTFLINQALSNRNLESALDNLNKLPSNIEDVNSFKQKIMNKINLETSFFNIENILLNKPDCNIVSK